MYFVNTQNEKGTSFSACVMGYRIEVLSQSLISKNSPGLPRTILDF